MKEHATKSPGQVMAPLEAGTAKDPICGMIVEKAKALTTEKGGRT